MSGPAGVRCLKKNPPLPMKPIESSNLPGFQNSG
jgi:hypothetical protein